MLAKRLSAAAAISSLVFAWTVTGTAQTSKPAPQRVRVATTIVKPDMVGTYEELIKNEELAAQKKGGVTYRWTFAGAGPVGTGFSYVTVTPLANYAQFDLGSAIRRGMGDGGIARYNAKLRPTIVSQSAIVQTLIADASVQSFSPTPPPLVRVTNYSVLPGKGVEFARLTTQEYLPALKKAGVTDYWVFATSLGGSPDERTIVTTANKWADFDMPGPLVRGIGQQAADALSARRAALTSGASVTVMSFRADLSYGAPARPASSKD